MNVFVLDNYDSFTYNLVQYLSELGAHVDVERNDAVSVDDVRKSSARGIVLSPGPGRPGKAGIMNELVSGLYRDMPMLGVCLGHQAIAEVFGGRIDYAPTLMHGKVSEIHHGASPLFRGVDSPFVATRYHSLVVDRASFPPDLKVTAWTDDGIIMALEHSSLPLYGVQFHPESILTACGKQILKNFLEML